MVQGQTGTLSLDVRSSVDKGVSEDHRGDFTYKTLHPNKTLFFCLWQRRVMFLRNDYFYTVINETPFRFVLEK